MVDLFPGVDGLDVTEAMLVFRIDVLLFPQLEKELEVFKMEGRASELLLAGFVEPFCDWDAETCK